MREFALGCEQLLGTSHLSNFFQIAANFLYCVCDSRMLSALITILLYMHVPGGESPHTKGRCRWLRKRKGAPARVGITLDRPLYIGDAMFHEDHRIIPVVGQDGPPGLLMGDDEDQVSDAQLDEKEEMTGET